MQSWAKLTPKPDFNLVTTASQSQAATLVVDPGKRVEGTDENQEKVDHWLYVMSGEGRLAVSDEAVSLGPGSLVLIEAGEPNVLHNLGDAPLETLNIYAPTAY